MTPEQRDAARRAGRHAGALGLPLETCPYDANGSDEQKALARIWVAEHRRNLVDRNAGVDFTE